MIGGENDSYTVTSAAERDNVSTSSMFVWNNETFGNTSEGNNRTVRVIRSGFYDSNLRAQISLVIGVIGLPSLVILIAMMSTSKYRRYSYSLYLTIMSVYDFVFILFELIESILKIMVGDKIIRSYLIWDFPCKMFNHLYYASMNISMWMNVAVAVDRYIVIAFPFKKDAWCNRRNSWIVSLGLMVIVHSAGIIFYLKSKVVYVTLLDIGYYCLREPILFSLDVYLNYMGGVMSALFVICVFTTLSVSKLHSIRKKRLEMTSKQPISNKDKTSRASVALIAIGVSAFVTQMPYVVNEMVRLYARYYDRSLYLLLWFGNIPGYRPAVHIFEALSFLINIQNFYFLFILNGPFRKDVIKMLTCGRTCRQQPTSSTSQPSITVVSDWRVCQAP